ncbi:T9SS sorting signal type C domain-containing protein [Flavobacterium terrigena]|uniref:Por secretion system C-terminal sorting domain-containing protein n=1 Tax=Flavobacterium terrigena TaxID=402734 RepID=A0A1H6VGS4_9FLAO|nr:T9SS sorting signal type C domain-containing protein [Flavobacterium terrigena]SEJ03743.1 hypothetical protein SAMN05660918_2232 [Flavobacterium terrigena]
MKNKLLKISVLTGLIAISCYFVYHNGYLQEFNLEKKEIKRSNTSNKQNVVESPVIKTEENATEENLIVENSTKLIATNSKQNFSKGRTVSVTPEIQSEEKNVSTLSQKELDSIEKIREKYQNTIVNHPFRQQMILPKKERKAMGLPPNAYNEQEWLYTMDPNLGRPTPEVTLDLQKTLDAQLENGRVPGDGLDNQWVERGPNNVGGRTRVLFFAPGSTTKVFAGAVNGGLWVNTDITNAATSWTQVSGVPSNMAVTCLTVDPQNSQIMYLGTGEVYTWGAVNGNGVYKSIDGGTTWRLIYGTSIGAALADQLSYIQDIIAWRNPTTGLTEVYFGADAMYYSEAVGATQWVGTNMVGLWKSTDGINFAKFTNVALQSSAGTYCAPNSFSIDFTGNLFMGTKRSAFGAGGGRIYKCTTGTDWALVRTLSGVNGRVQLKCSRQTAGRAFALCEDYATKKPVIKRSADNFAADDTTVSLPTSIGAQPPAANDFCRQQAFYDLMIGLNPSDDNEVYVGGIEIFKTTTAFTGANSAMWTQLTDWTINPTAAGNATANSLDGVHSDHHVMAFCPTQTSRVVFGCDGGVYYSNNSGTAIGERNKDYNVTQVYKGSIDQSVANNKMLGGLQDNGSQLMTNPAMIGAGTEIYGGDGCWEFIDKQQQYIVASYVYNRYVYCTYAGAATVYISNNTTDGDFVNQCTLDSNLNILYTNGSSSGTYRIFRNAINPADGATVSTTLTNAAINAIPTYFETSPYTPDRIMVGLSTGRLVRMDTASGTPVYTIIATPFAGAISDIKYGNSENDLFVTMHNYGIASIYYSADGGANWSNKEGNLPNIPVKCILQNPNATNEVIIGTELGVWYTVDFNVANPNWRRANTGMKDCKVLSFDYRAADQTILAATFGRGMWTGKFWQCGATTKTWNGTAWSPAGTPTSKDAVVFTGNYTSTATLDACSVTVNTGAAVTFLTGHSLRVGENVTVNGTGSLTINSGAALVQYTKHAVNTGNIIVKRNSANMIHNDYTAWASPVVNQNLLAFSPNTLATRFYTYNRVNSGTSATAYTSVAPGSTAFATAKGYMIRVNNNWTLTPAVYNGQFTGVPNNGTLTYAVGVGYELLGNPYASPISAYRLLITNPKLNTLYYWTHTAPASGGIYPINNYASYTTLGGTASAAGGAIPNDKINVGQGFFVQSAVAYTVTFENELREDAVTTSQFFKNPNAVAENVETEKHRIWLNLNDATKSYNQILVGYTTNATDGIDSKIDGKMLDTSKTMLYNLIDNDAYVIQGKGLPFSDEDVVKLGLKVTEASNFEINIEQVDGIFANHDVFVKDNYTRAIHNLKEGSYYFISQDGTFNDRFELIYKKAVKEDVATKNTVDVLVKNNELTIQTYQSAIVSVEVYDVLGKVIFTKNGINNKQFNTNQITASKQALVVIIQLENGEVVTKKIIM